MATAIIFTDNSDVINAFILASFVIIFPYTFFLSLIAVVKYGKLIGFGLVTTFSIIVVEILFSKRK